MKLLKKIFDILTTDISVVNRRIFSLPITGVPPKEEIFNKHMQNLVWMFWFRTLLYKKD